MSMATTHTVTDSERSAPDTCDRCLGDITHDPRESYCEDCGLVVDDAPIDHGPDWRNFDSDDDDPSRAAPTDRNLNDRGLGSEIQHTRGATMSHRRQRMLHRQSKSEDSKARSRAYITIEIKRMASALELPRTVTDRACHIVRTAHENDDFNFTNLDCLSATSLFIAARENQMGRTAGDIEGVARTDSETILRRMRKVAAATGAELPPPDPLQRTRVVATRLPDGDRHVDAAIAALERSQTGECRGVTPSGLAASALYAVGPWTQKDVADAAGVCTPTIRNYYRELDVAD